VAIVEDDETYARTVGELLDQSGDFCCVATCPSAEKALAVLPGLRPAVVLMDIGLPGASGVSGVRELRRLLPATEIMMFTVFEDTERICQSLEAGATGYLLKRSTGPEILAAIRDLMAGGSPMSAAIARKVVLKFRQPPAQGGDLAVLTAREMDVLEALAAGRGYKGVALKLDMNPDTVRTHIQHIYRKLHVHSSIEAVRKLGGPFR
jgi:DNA-binding NarL/FixJ family response regulator